MGRFLIKDGDQYLVWSTVVDAPITYFMSEKETTTWLKREYGRYGISSIRPDWFGRARSLDDVEFNRAGEKESQLTADEIREAFKTPQVPESGPGPEQALP